MPRILIAASGTGGHIFPALAVAEALPQCWNVRWLGVPDRLETNIVPDKFRLVTVNAGGLQKSIFHKLFRIFQLISAALTVTSFIKRQKINIVFTTGGYIAAPAILGARLCGIPVILHESNAIPGKVTRYMGRLCHLVAIGLPQTTALISNARTILTGTPVRKEFTLTQPIPNWVPKGSGPLLVVIGGSQGALGLNQMIRPLLPSLLNAGCRIVHLTGDKDPDRGQIHHPSLIEKEFSNEMAGLLQHADLAISRAGAGSLSELAICGTPSILIPFPQASDRHQDANASCAAATGGAVIVHQHPPTENTLRETINRLLNARLRKNNASINPLTEMSKKIQKLAVIDAEQRLAELLIALD